MVLIRLKWKKVSRTIPMAKKPDIKSYKKIKNNTEEKQEKGVSKIG